MNAVKSPPSLDDYTIVLFRDDNGTFVASAPAVRGCYAMGFTRDHALAELAGVFEMCVDVIKELGEEMPADIDPETIPFAG